MTRPGKAYTRATRMAATFLAKQSGAEAAAKAFGIDPRTIRSWLETIEIPEDQWTAIRDVLLARGAEMAATGKTTGLAAVLTGAGISERNVRYGQLIERREARRSQDAEAALPEPDPVRDALALMPDVRQRWLRDSLDDQLELDRIRDANGDMERDTDGDWTEADSAAWIQFWTDATPEQLDTHMAGIGAEARELLTGWTASRDGYGYIVLNRYGVEFTRVSSMDGMWASVPVLVDAGDRPDVNPAEADHLPDAPERHSAFSKTVSAPEKHVSMLIDMDSGPNTWHPLEPRGGW